MSSIPAWQSLASSPECQTLSKAELTSRNRPWVILLSPQFFLILCTIYNNWETVESPLKYAACLCEIISFSWQCLSNLSCITDSQIFDKVGNNEIGRKFLLSVLEPDFLWIAITCAIFQVSGKCPTSNKSLNNQDKEKEIGVEIRWINFPGIPQCDKWDFLIFLIILATSSGDVFTILRGVIPSVFSKTGTGSSLFRTVDFEAKKLLKILLCCNGSWTVTLFSINGGTLENLLFFMSLNRILNFFFADIAGFFNVLFTKL